MHGNSAEWEIETYTSSAPDFIGDYATVVSASGDVLREGTNGWTCLPFIAMPKMGFKTANEAAPACADANAVAASNASIYAGPAADTVLDPKAPPEADLYTNPNICRIYTHVYNFYFLTLIKKSSR